MLPRGLEVLLVSLLLVVTAGTVFQFMNNQTQTANQQLLRQAIQELRETREQLSDAIAARPHDAAPPHRAAGPAPVAPTATAIHHHRPAATEVAEAEPKPATNSAPRTPASAPEHPHPVAETAAPPVAEKPAEDPAVKSWQTYGPAVTNVIENLLAGHYDAVAKRFDPTMSSQLSTAQLAAVIDPIRKAHGPMKELTRHAPLQANLPANMHAFQVTTELTDGHKLLFTITLDDQQHVSGLFMK